MIIHTIIQLSIIKSSEKHDKKLKKSIVIKKSQIFFKLIKTCISKG